MKKREIAMPYQGFYVIVPPGYRSLGCRPAEQFIPDLMNYLGEYYYVGLLSAAEYHLLMFRAGIAMAFLWNINCLKN